MKDLRYPQSATLDTSPEPGREPCSRCEPLGLGPEDEAALPEEADRNYREWMRIIGEESPD